MKVWTAINQHDGNDTFEVEGEAYAEAASEALQALGWALCIPDENDGVQDEKATTVTRPLSAKEFRKHIGKDGRVRLCVEVDLYDIINCSDMGAFNELVDERLYGDGVHGVLTDLHYRPVSVDGDNITISVEADTSELELKAEK